MYGSRDYTEGVDLWAVGCIFGELLNNCPLFPGENDIDQLGLVIRHLGTPTEQVWPGVSTLPDYSKITFPDCTRVSYQDMVPEASTTAVDLLKQFVIYDSGSRMSAREAVKHEYFYERPFPATINEMTKPREKTLEMGSKEHNIDVPLHTHFEKILHLLN